MKGIVKVNKNSSHAHCNGLTFTVAEFLYSGNKLMFCLIIDKIRTDFAASEVIMVDFQAELQRAYDDANWDSQISKQAYYNALVRYAKEVGINYQAVYNCLS